VQDDFRFNYATNLLQTLLIWRGKRYADSLVISFSFFCLLSRLILGDGKASHAFWKTTLPHHFIDHHTNYVIEDLYRITDQFTCTPRIAMDALHNAHVNVSGRIGGACGNVLDCCYFLSRENVLSLYRICWSSTKSKSSREMFALQVATPAPLSSRLLCP
jgi:hypothetical protein